MKARNLFKFVGVVEGAENSDTSGKDMLINAAILAGLGFFSTTAGLLASGTVNDPVSVLVAAGVSSGVQFFTSLAIQRRLKR